MSCTRVQNLNQMDLFQTIDLMVRVLVGEVTFRQRSRSVGLVWEIETRALKSETMQLKQQFKMTP